VALAALLTGLPFAPSAAASPTANPIVVLVAIPGLQWSDVANMPILQQFLAHSAVGELSVKTAGGTTRCSAALLAVGAGNRTGDPDGDCPIPPTSWPTLSHSNATSKYRTTIGLLGTTLHAAGVTTLAVGPLAAPMLADEQGVTDQVVPTLSAAVSAASQATAGAVIATLDPDIYDLPPGADRMTETQQVDANLATTLAALPAGATVIVAGISNAAVGHAHLQLLAISGPGWRHTELRSSAAGRAPYVQLIDIAPTILSLEGVAIPSVIVGRPVQQSGEAVRSASAYADDDRHAYDQRTLGQRTFLALGIAAILLMSLTLFPFRVARTGARWLARVLAPAPMLVFVGNAFPWWRWGQPVYAVIVVGSAVVVAVVATLAARRSAVNAAIVPLAATLIALVCDQLTGAHLQLSAPLGDSPIVAGRFSGVGNLDFSEIATAALLLAGLVGAKIGGRRGVLVAAVIAVVAVIVDGAPQLGDDIGGVFALVPGAIVVVALLMQARITWRRALVAIGATVVVAVGVALADYSRPAASQSHVGRFVGQILHGGAGPEVHRKLDAALATFGLTVGTFVAAVTIATGIVARRRIAVALRDTPGLTAGAVAATVTALLGVALNDSGIPIASMAAIVGVSAVYGAVGGRESDVAGGRTPLPTTPSRRADGMEPLAT
jgi:hypothetical protein